MADQTIILSNVSVSKTIVGKDAIGNIGSIGTIILEGNSGGPISNGSGNIYTFWIWFKYLWV
jgi:hypothetical protein